MLSPAKQKCVLSVKQKTFSPTGMPTGYPLHCAHALPGRERDRIDQSQDREKCEQVRDYK